MKRELDLAFVSRIIFLLVLSVVIGYTFYSLIRMDERNLDKQAEQVAAIAEKAAVQCYALEGAFPNSIEYLAKYGVIFNDEKFYYRYEMNDIGNYMPQIYVTPKE